MQDNRLISFIETTKQLLNLLFIHTSRAIVKERTSDKTTPRLVALELISDTIITLLGLVVNGACLVEAWLNKVMLLHLLHFFLHAINFSIDAPLLKLNFCDVLVNVSLLLLTQVIFLTDFPEHLDQFRILLCAISKLFLRFLVRLETILLKLPNLLFAELEMLVELVNQFRVLLLLSHDLF